MNIDRLVLERLFKKVEQLSPEEIGEVENFIDNINQRNDENLEKAATQLSEAAFAAVWNNLEDSVYDDL
ncbi:MAG: toxin-antitoxin system, antitoxin component, Xre family protein [Cyanobacteria bacterium P01_G01_bin.49]